MIRRRKGPAGTTAAPPPGHFARFSHFHREITPWPLAQTDQFNQFIGFTLIILLDSLT